jgi:hypothetical protein
LEALLRDLGVLPEDDTEPGGYLFPDYRRVRRHLFLKEIACGPIALMAVLQAFGVSLTEEEADGLLAESGDKGIDLLRLKELAERHGLHALGVATSTEGLRRLGHRAIVHLNGVGFAAVTGFTPEGVILTKPLEPAGVLPDDLFARAFGKEGKAILVSHLPLSPDRLGIAKSDDSAPPAGPSLRMAKNMLTVGRLHRRGWKAELVISNEGTELLRIKQVTASHSCLKASVERDRLASGESTVLRAEGTHGRLGPMTYFIQLETNEPGASMQRIPVRGYAEAPVCFVTPTVLFRSLLPKQAAEAEIEFDVPAGVAISRLRVKKAGESMFVAELKKGVRGPILSVRWNGSDRVGWHHSSVEVVSGDEKDAIAAALPCAAEVVSGVEVFPPSLVIGNGRTDRGT